jgi:hypothetical protein
MSPCRVLSGSALVTSAFPQAVAEASAPAPAPVRRPAAVGWCNNKDLHKLLNLPGQKTHCPLKTLTEKSKAREGAKWAMDQKRATPAKDVQELLTTALTQFV